MSKKELVVTLLIVAALAAGVIVLSREPQGEPKGKPEQKSTGQIQGMKLAKDGKKAGPAKDQVRPNAPPPQESQRPNEVASKLEEKPQERPQEKPAEQPLVEQEDWKPDPRFVVAPVDEPVEPEDEDFKDDKSKKVVLMPHGGRIHFDSRKVVIPGMILMQGGPIELFACAEGGKEHESVVRLHTSPWQLNLGILGCKFKKGAIPKTLSIQEKGQGDRALIFLQWKQKDGKVVTYRAEDLIVDRRRDALMPRVGWTFLGSQFEPEFDAESGKPTGKSHFVADRVRTLMATYHDTGSIFDTPLPEGMDDTWFEANYSLLPPMGTPVKIIIRPPSDKEGKDIERTEAAALVWTLYVDIFEKQARIEDITRQRQPELEKELKTMPVKTSEDQQRADMLKTMLAELSKERIALIAEVPQDQKRYEELQKEFEKKYGAVAPIPNLKNPEKNK